MANEYVLRVAQLNEYVSGMLQREKLLQGIGVRGEISGFKRYASGHLYFSLKDEAAIVRCVMFRQNAMRLGCELRDGLQVVAHGNVSLYVRDGQYQFYVDAVQPEGEGELYRRFLLLKTRLEAQGLFDAAHKKPLPYLPRRIGVVTSPSGAVLHDIESVTRRRFPEMPIALYPVQVQGEGAAAQIAQGVREMNSRHAADVLIVGRGGGSMEDLWAFNEEVVARAIFESELPVVSAVGHETDFSIADFVADRRAPTPSAAAELCVPDYAALRENVENIEETLRDTAHDALLRRRSTLEALRASAGFAQPGFALRSLRERIEHQWSGAQTALRTSLSAAWEAQNALAARLEALSPQRVLARGYALIRTDAGYAADIDALRPLEDVEIVMRGGVASATLHTITKGSDPNA